MDRGDLIKTLHSGHIFSTNLLEQCKKNKSMIIYFKGNYPARGAAVLLLLHQSADMLFK